ncbi:MAG: hypothetical protein NDI90_14240 [Nitrospira sp. BO4]|jgi:hypothetical protein|nr:hypothetical protein [Nitrospira sp. BO4]
MLHSQVSQATNPTPHLSPDPIELVTTQEYQKCTISVLVSQTVTGLWRSRYVLIRFSPSKSAYIAAYPDGAYATREEAEAAALQRGQRIVDFALPTVA